MIMARKDTTTTIICEAGDRVYHLLVTLERYGITPRRAGRRTQRLPPPRLVLGERRGLPFAGGAGDIEGSVAAVVGMCPGPRGCSSRCRRRGARPSQK